MIRVEFLQPWSIARDRLSAVQAQERQRICKHDRCPVSLAKIDAANEVVDTSGVVSASIEPAETLLLSKHDPVRTKNDTLRQHRMRGQRLAEHTNRLEAHFVVA